MNGARLGRRFTSGFVLATVCVVLLAGRSTRNQIRPLPAALAAAPAELVDRLRSDPFTYFRFVNRSWAARVCEAFADVSDLPIVQLHGDAHLEQFAFTDDAWGLTDFDDAARGPEFIDLVRFLGSIDLATRQRGWSGDREALWDRFLEGYGAGLSNPKFLPAQPEIVRVLRAKTRVPRAVFLARGESQMQPMDAATTKTVVAGMEALERFVRGERPDVPAGYFAVKHAGWLRIGVGSAATRKVLIRVQGLTADDGDDELLEAKEVANLEGVRCVEGRTSPPALRIIDGTRQLSRVKHDVLAIGPTLRIPAAADRAEYWLDWWVFSWEPSYREVSLSDLRSVKDLADIVFDSGVQLGAGVPDDVSVRKQTLSKMVSLKGRIRKETAILVEELLAGWRELGGR